MIIQNKNLFTNNSSNIESFNIEDCRNISFSIANESDECLHEILVSKITNADNAVDKFNSLLLARLKFINEIWVLNNGESNINLNVSILRKSLIDKIKPIEEILCIDGMNITLDYPTSLYIHNHEDLIINCIKKIQIKENSLNFNRLDKSEKYDIVNKLKASTIESIFYYIHKNNKNIILLDSSVILNPISVNFFDNSAFFLLKSLYHYYDYDSIIEMLFILSKRFNDISFLNTRTPLELDSLIRMYEDENSQNSRK
jgi:hypothetical protein